jgi:hypothetical protein
MADKPTTAEGYTSDQVALVRATCLYVATKLGDLIEDLVVVGGLVPSLLVDQRALPQGAQAHVGTLDLDVGLTVALLDEGRYHTLTELNKIPSQVCFAGLRQLCSGSESRNPVE